MKKIALKYLNQDYSLHIDMIELLLHHEAEIVMASLKGVLLLDKSKTIAFLSAVDLSTYQSMMSLPFEVSLMVIHHEFALTCISKDFNLDITCYNHYYPLDSIQVPKHSFDIVTLDESYFEFVLNHYHHADSSYILERLKEHVVVGLFKNNECLGFIGEHEEGSIGMLEIIPQYRKQGLASILLSFKISQELSKNHRPFSQVAVNNIPSLKLHESFLFIRSHTPIYWYSKQ